MIYSNLKNAINHYVVTGNFPTRITGYRLNTILNDMADTISALGLSTTLTAVLTNGNTTANGQVIKALNGGGQLDLRVTARGDNAVFLSNDNGAMTKEWIWIEDNFMAMYVAGGSLSYIEVSEHPTIPLNSYMDIGTPGSLLLRSRGGQYADLITPAAAQTYTFPEASGTLALTSDIETQPLKYKALLSQNAPVVTTQTPTILAGQIWEDTIGTADAADLIVLGGYELMSGVLGAVNATYRSAADDTPTFNTSSFAYDGSPYVVSTDANGDFNPFVNTLGTYQFALTFGDGEFSITIFGAFNIGKTNIKFGNIDLLRGKSIGYGVLNNDTIYFYTYYISDGVSENDLLYYTPFEIEIYP